MKYEGNHEHTIKGLKRIKKYRNDKGAKNVTGARVIDAAITVARKLGAGAFTFYVELGGK